MSDATSYLPFARKYRPQSFAELLGQEALVKTLSFAIQKKHLPSSILLSGIRGVGKTSSARIVAKTILCENTKPLDQLIINCNECKNCQAVASNSHPDIVEIDAASHTGVDDAREIIQSAEYMPILGSHKIFIIDEVHMLSRSAFNALLKTLEEPPRHVLFIFATTEVQKIPSTIISRCQRFDLKRLNFQTLIDMLKDIANKEGISIQQQALSLIAVKSEGSAREANSMLDQLASYAFSQRGNQAEINAEDVNAMLGLVSNDVILKLLEAIIKQDASLVTEITSELYQSHNNLELLLQDITNFLAELTKLKLIENYNNPILDSHLAAAKEIASCIELSQLTILWQIINSSSSDLKQTSNQLICCQMALIKAMHFCAMPPMEKLASETISNKVNINDAPKELSLKKKPELDKAAAQSVAVNKINDICKLLDFCQKQGELGVAFCILNEAELVSFNDKRLILKGSIPQAMQPQILKLLRLWSGNEEATIELHKTDDFIPIKDTFEQIATSSPQLVKIKELFPQAKVTDILLAD